MTNSTADTDWVELKITGGVVLYIRPTMIMWFMSLGGSSTRICDCQGVYHDIVMSCVDFKAKMGLK